MKIETADINTIKPYENNPRKLKDSAIEKVGLKLLKEDGLEKCIEGITTVEEIMRVTMGG